MARPSRICYPGALYHVTARGNERRPIFRDHEDRQRFLRTLASMADAYGVICHAFVLMDNHYHLVIETPLANLSRALRHLNGVYTQAFNRRHDRVGHLFQGRFFAILIDKDGYLLNVCRYVVLNPVRAQLVTAPDEWPWSSYRATAGLSARPRFLAVDGILTCFGTRPSSAQRAYRRFVADGMTPAASPWRALRGRTVLGGDDFLDELRARVGEAHAGEVLKQGFGARRDERAPRLEDVLRRVGHAYGIAPESLLTSSRPVSEARRVAIFAARRVARLDLRTIADRFGIGSPAISKHVGAIADRLATDRTFGARVRASLGNGKT